MLKVLIADDEPFILQGLQVLIDWEKEGYEQPYTANDGEAALAIIRENDIDLIISDIKMPNMSGLDLLSTIRTVDNIDTYFVILSGFAEFSYAQEALRYECADYILKPVEKDSLLEILQKVAILKAGRQKEDEEKKKKDKEYLDFKIMSLLDGRYDEASIFYIEKELKIKDEQLCYLDISMDVQTVLEDLSDEEKAAHWGKVYGSIVEYLKDEAISCVRDVSSDDKRYDVGIIYKSSVANKLNISDREYFSNLFDYINNLTNLPITLLVGKYVNDLKGIPKSYGTANMLRFLQGFREKKDIYYYEDEYKITGSGIHLCKNTLDDLIEAIDINEHMEIHKQVDALFNEMHESGITKETMNLNINYLVFQLIHLATELDSEVNQEEILRFISETTFDEGIRRGSKMHLCRMAYEYGDYLSQLRKNVSKGVLGDVEEEIKKNYTTNLTLKDLSEKYYINSAYLGQIFRKKYGCSFKDYLNKYRMDEAAKLLVKSDMKIYEIAETVGYKDVDYFVNKFISVKGCTPAKYRKQS